MRRLPIMALVVAVAIAPAIARPVEAKKPDKPDTGFHPTACQVDVAFLSADIRNAEGTIHDVPAENGAFTLTATAAGGFNETRYTVESGTPDVNDVLCVEVKLLEGALSDLRVRWLDCQDCGLYRATGKDLKNFNNGEVFSAGVGVADWTEPSGQKTVAVMPNTKTNTATMTVTIGIDQP